jgi:hypothetical protein
VLSVELSSGSLLFLSVNLPSFLCIQGASPMIDNDIRVKEKVRELIIKMHDFIEFQSDLNRSRYELKTLIDELEYILILEG